MSDDKFAAMTLAEIEAIAARLEAAARVFRDARALLGGAGAGPESIPPATRPSPAPPQLTAYEQAQREALLARNREALPDDIKRAEGMQ